MLKVDNGCQRGLLSGIASALPETNTATLVTTFGRQNHSRSIYIDTKRRAVSFLTLQGSGNASTRQMFAESQLSVAVAGCGTPGSCKGMHVLLCQLVAIQKGTNSRAASSGYRSLVVYTHHLCTCICGHHQQFTDAY